MLTQTKDAPAGSSSRPRPCPAAIAAIVIAIVIALAVGGDRLGRGARARSGSATDGAVDACCSTTYVLPFEIVSVLLLAAVIGGVFLAKREQGGPS